MPSQSGSNLFLRLWMKSESVAIQLKVLVLLVLVLVLFIMVCKVVLTSESVDEILNCHHSK